MVDNIFPSILRPISIIRPIKTCLFVDLCIYGKVKNNERKRKT